MTSEGPGPILASSRPDDPSDKFDISAPRSPCYERRMRYSIDEIETFLTVMDLGTVTAAADRLNLSKSVVSKRITDFESALGAALFRRNAGRISPTDAAVRLAERLRGAMSELKAAVESGAWGGSGEQVLRGRLTIASPMSFGTTYLTPIIADFATLHPELEIVVDYDDRSRDLLHDGFDVAIRIGQLRDESLMARRIVEDLSIPCASPDYIARHGAPAHPSELSQFDVIDYSHRSGARLWEYTKSGKPISPSIRSRIAMNNGDAIRDFLIAGLGIGILPGFIVGPAIAEGKLVQLFPQLPLRSVPISVVWPPVNPMPVKLRAFVDHVGAAFSGGAPWPLPAEPGEK